MGASVSFKRIVVALMSRGSYPVGSSMYAVTHFPWLFGLRVSGSKSIVAERTGTCGRSSMQSRWGP